MAVSSRGNADIEGFGIFAVVPGVWDPKEVNIFVPPRCDTVGGRFVRNLPMISLTQLLLIRITRHFRGRFCSIGNGCFKCLGSGGESACSGSSRSWVDKG